MQLKVGDVLKVKIEVKGNGINSVEVDADYDKTLFEYKQTAKNINLFPDIIAGLKNNLPGRVAISGTLPGTATVNLPVKDWIVEISFQALAVGTANFTLFKHIARDATNAELASRATNSEDVFVIETEVIEFFVTIV